MIFGGKISTPERLSLPTDIIANLEVLNHDALYTLIKNWAAKFPSTGAEIVWVFGKDVVYEHVMAEEEKTVWESVVVRFLDLLPFEEVESRVYHTVKESKVVAINKDLYNALKRGFALQGYVTRAEIAVTELGEFSTAQSLDAKVAGYIADNLDIIERNRIVKEEMPSVSVNVPIEPTKKKSNLPLLLAVFAVLLGILAYMYLTMSQT
jgi:hypothetical protein